MCKKGIIAKRIIALLLPIVLSVSLLCACDVESNGTIFGTYYSISYDSSSAVKSKSGSETILEDWTTLDNLESTQILTSDVVKINSAQADVPIEVSELTINCLKLSIEYNLLFPDFNPAIYPLVELWKFSPDTFIGVAQAIPTEEEIKTALAYCKLSLFSYDENARTITKSDSRAKLDFGSFLKGVAVDSAKKTLENENDTLINLGGTIYSKNYASIAVANPRGGDYRAKVAFTDASVATSGDYERCYIFSGKRYHHIIDSSGHPAGINSSNPITSVTVVGESATICDILSTAVFISGTGADGLLKVLGYSALILTDISAQTIGANNAQWTIL